MGPAAAGGARNEPAKRLPEASLNGMILRWTFIDKAKSGFGALALAWATIVLLGGFSTVIKQKDFWFVTIISFMEATRFSRSAVYPDQFIINAPEVLAATTERNEAMERGSWRRYGDTLELAPPQRTSPREGIRGMITSINANRRCTGRLLIAKIFVMSLTLALCAANITSVILAVLRLRKQDFVDPMYEGSSDHKSIKGSLNLFYGLVLAQGVSSFLAETMLTPDIQQLMKLSLTYQLGASGPQIIKRYMIDTYLKCSRGSVREAMNMDLVTVDLFVQKLKKILDLYESPSPTTEFPGIRRATVELIILMTRAVDNAMKEVAETEARLERFKLFYCGVGVAKHSESISSLVIGL